MRRLERDDHHTQHTKRVHEVYPVHAAIRENPSMIAHGMARVVHNLLHSELPPVPLLSYHTALRVANRLPRDLDIFEGIDEFSRIVEQSARHPKIKPLEIDIDALAVRVLREQIPYIREGMPRSSTIFTGELLTGSVAV